MFKGFKNLTQNQKYAIWGVSAILLVLISVVIYNHFKPGKGSPRFVKFMALGDAPLSTWNISTKYAYAYKDTQGTKEVGQKSGWSKEVKSNDKANPQLQVVPKTTYNIVLYRQVNGVDDSKWTPPSVDSSGYFVDTDNPNKRLVTPPTPTNPPAWSDVWKGSGEGPVNPPIVEKCDNYPTDAKISCAGQCKDDKYCKGDRNAAGHWTYYDLNSKGGCIKTSDLKQYSNDPSNVKSICSMPMS